ncbi:MAG: SDR family NAD(P)-dependent oxidoreductase [Lachnospiraceae bacterium]|jgi:meso-butanediol dehydrogenase/(S,S)-butanediol dehydrogenase/diacetyl reductase
MGHNLLEGKVVVITGSTRGIGYGMAMCCADEGAYVVASGRDEEMIRKVDEELKPYNGMCIHADATSMDSLNNLMEKAYERYGKIDFVVANAGITDVCLIDDLDVARFEKMININLEGEFKTIKAGLPYLRKNEPDGEIRGKIVCTGSDCSLAGWAHLTSYSAAKFAVRGMVQALARELGPEGITVNCIVPGIIETEMWKTHDKLACAIEGLEPGQAWQNEVAKIPLGRGGLPEDLGKGLVMLLSHYADYITGCSLPVGGGSSIH